MFKPLYGLSTVLLAPALLGDTLLTVDALTFCRINAALSGTEYSYAVLRDGFNYEVVKITGTSAGKVSVVRAQDTTLAQGFPSGAELFYALTKVAIDEIVADAAAGEIVLTGDGVVTVERLGPNNWTVGMPEITIVSLTEQLIVGGSYPEFTLALPAKLDCCND